MPFLPTDLQQQVQQHLAEHDVAFSQPHWQGLLASFHELQTRWPGFEWRADQLATSLCLSQQFNTKPELTWCRCPVVAANRKP